MRAGVITATGICLALVAGLGGCSSAPVSGPVAPTNPGPDPESTPAEVTPPDEMPEGDFSFTDGQALVNDGQTTVQFRNGIASVYDWEPLEPSPPPLNEGGTAIGFINSHWGCTIHDESSPYAGEADDEGASLALLQRVVGDAQMIGEPYRSIWGTAGREEGVGEGGPTIDVMQVQFEGTDGTANLVTARALPALSTQHFTLITCDTWDGTSFVQAQLIQVAYIDLNVPPR